MSNAIYKYNGILCSLVRKTIISCIILSLFQACSEKKTPFFREKEVLKVIDEIGIKNNESLIFLVVRTNRCDLCTYIARDYFNQSQTNVILLMDSDDSSFHKHISNPFKSVIIKPGHFFESRGIDFSENYLFILKNGSIRNFSIVSRETKDKIAEIVDNEMF